MKAISLLSAAILFSVSTAQAAGNVRYKCVSERSGKTYVAIPAFGEIHEYSASGKELGYRDSMTAETRVIETYPPRIVTQFVHEEGDVVAEIIEEQDGFISMEIDGDASLTCKKSK